MSVWLAGAVVLLAGVVVPAGWLVSRGRAAERLVGLEMGSVAVTMELTLWSQAAGQPQYLIVPLVAAVVSFAGTLLYTRLLAPRSRAR